MTVVEETESLSHNESEEPPTKKMKKIITDDNVKEEEDNDTATTITLKNQKNSANSTTKEEDQEEHSDASAPANMAVVKKEEKKKRTTSTKKVTKVPFEERLKECIAFKRRNMDIVRLQRPGRIQRRVSVFGSKKCAVILNCKCRRGNHGNAFRTGTSSN